MKIDLAPVDAVSITTLVDNITDITIPNQGPASRPSRWAKLPRQSTAVLADGWVTDILRAEHGFSALVAIKRAESSRSVLFDAGYSPDGLAENIRRLGLSAGEIEAIVLSHGRADHVTGLDGLARVLTRPNLPVLVHPEFWVRRRNVAPGREPVEAPRPSKPLLRAAGFEVIEERRPSLLLDGALLVTGEVERTTKFEGSVPGYEEFLDGEWRSEPWVPHEQALVMHVVDKGLVVLAGCSHAGIVNIVRYARKLTGIERIYAIVGGFHLGGPDYEPRILATVAALKKFAPNWIVPTHCTGWRAIHAIAAEFPEAFIQNTVGTRFNF